MFRTCGNNKCYMPFEPEVNQIYCPKCEEAKSLKKCSTCHRRKKVYGDMKQCSLCHYVKHN